MKPQKHLSLDRTGRCFVMLLIAGTGLLALIFAGVIPTARQIDETKREIAGLEADLHEHRSLQPAYIALREEQQRNVPEPLRIPERTPLPLDDLAALPFLFEALARASNLQLVSAIPQVRSLRDGREMLRVDTLMRGDFQAFSALIQRLNHMPYIEQIENLSIDVAENGQELRLSIWLAIQ